MAEILTAIRSARGSKANAENENDGLLTAVESRDAREPRSEAADHPVQVPRSQGSPKRIDTPEDALEALRSRPDRERLHGILKHLTTHDGFSVPFTLHNPVPVQARIINVLLNTILPDFWSTLQEQDVSLLISCFQNITGLNAVTARLRLLASQGTSTKGSAQAIADTLELASAIFSGDVLLLDVWRNLRDAVADQTRRDLAWKEVVNLLGSGKLIAAVAQAEDVIKTDTSTRRRNVSRLSSGSEYAAWLGRNIAVMVQDAHDAGSISPSSALEHAAQLLAKALHLGHSPPLLEGFLQTGLSSKLRTRQNPGVLEISTELPAHNKRSFVEQLLRWLSSKTRSTVQLVEMTASSDQVSALTALFVELIRLDIKTEPVFRSQLIDPNLSQSFSLTVLRACVLSIAIEGEEECLQELLEKMTTLFSSTLFIAHASIAQQETLAKTMLLTAGYLHRKTPMALLMTARSSGHMQGVSNRLDSSNGRARWLGMVVGSAFSGLTDKPGAQMDFGVEDMQTNEARWYKDLVTLIDTIGTLDDVEKFIRRQPPSQKKSISPMAPQPAPAKIDGKLVFGPPRPPAPLKTTIVGERVTEIVDDESEDDSDGLKPYAKPDSDPEDSDEDATLVNRNKARAPVYIRDLMVGLRNDQDHDKFSVAIKNAAPLIRRKAGFGKEVTDHAEELVGMMCNLQDPFNTDDFDELRLQTLIALLLSDVGVVAPLLARQAFADGFSIAQRCVILSALGLGARELAGLNIEDEAYNPKLGIVDFPSKKLPARLHAIYGQDSDGTMKRLEAASRSIEHQMIQPIALQAADRSTADLNAVKIRTFSSRMEVEQARTKRKPPANELAKCFGQSFFYPLANRYQQEVAAYGSGSVFSSAPFVVVTFVKTLALLLHASGPATLALPQISAEMWDLLLSLRVQAISDISILQAVLFALLTLLEVNTDKQRIAQEHPKQLMETQQWVDLVFERMGSSGLVQDDEMGDEAKVKTLAAGVLMKCREIIDAYQKQLVGYDFS